MGVDNRNEPPTGVDRLVGFSDGVFAIAITLLVLNIEVPTAAPNVLLAEWPDVLSYVISFLVIGNYWINHHRIFQWIDQQDSRLLWFNLLFLLCIAFVPFPTSLLGDSITTVTVSVYAATLALTGVLSTGVWWYATRVGGLVRSAVAPRQAYDRTVRMLVPSAVFALSIPIALLDPVGAMYSWIALVVIDPVLDRVLATPE